MKKDCDHPQPITVELKVLNNLGLHARVAARIAATVQQFDSQVVFSKGQVEAEGDSVLSILTLDAPMGSTLQVSARGPQAQEVLSVLEKLFASRFGD